MPRGVGVPGRVRKHPAISGLSGREAGFPQACESTPPSLARPSVFAGLTHGTLHKPSTRGFACALCNVISVEVSPGQPGLREAGVVLDQSCLGADTAAEPPSPGPAAPTPG